MQAQVAADDVAVLHDLRHDVARHVDGNGETDALRGLNDGGVDADHLAAGFDERAAAVAGIERKENRDIQGSLQKKLECLLH